MIKYANEKGFDIFDLGGYQLNAKGNLVGVNSFKEKWGGKVEIYYVYGNLFYILGRKLVRNFEWIVS